MKSWSVRLMRMGVMMSLAAACGSDSEERERSGRSGFDASAEVSDSGASAEDASNAPSVESDAALVVGMEQPPETCADLKTTPVRAIPSVTFLVDGSGSMNCAYPENAGCPCNGKVCTLPGTESRWQALSKALLGDGAEAGLFGSLEQSVRFGLWVYHNARGALTCPGFPAQVAAELNQTALLRSSLPVTPPGDNTPTALALTKLVETLPSEEQAKQAGLGPQTIVLATDGQPFTCQDPVTLAAPLLDYDAVLSATRAAREKAVSVYVMSLAPAAGDFATHLQEVASLGDTAHAYTPADRSQLRAALEEIIAGSISCVVTLNGTVQKPEQCSGRARLGTSELQCGDPNGFKILDGSHVELLGSACARFKREPGIDLELTFPCDLFALE